MKKRILALVFTLLFILPVICSCAKPADSDGSDKNTTQDNETTGSSTTAVTDTEFVSDELGTKSFNKKISILYWEDVERNEFIIGEDKITGDRVDDSIISRNAAVEERLGVELDWQGTKGNYNNQKNFVTTCQTGNVDGLYDIFAGYSLTAATIALQGLSQNMLQLPYLDFSKPWWPESLISQATINDKLYFASGDISTNMLHMMYGVFFNKEMLKDLELEDQDPYELVANNGWTVRTMMRMCQTAYQDTGDTPDKKDDGDTYGYVSTDINYDGLYIGCGFKTIENSENGLIISPDFGSEEVVDLVDLCVTFFNEQYAYGSSTVAVPAARIFAEGRALMVMDRVYLSTSTTMRDFGEDIKYGVVPCPKYTKKQESYVTMLGFPYTMYSISSAAKNPEEAAAVLECLGSEGYRKVTPELFETVMKVKYTTDETASYMYDLIKSSIYIDLGRIFSSELGAITFKLFRDRLKTKTNNYTTQYTTAEGLLNGENGYLAIINAKFYD